MARWLTSIARPVSRKAPRIEASLPSPAASPSRYLLRLGHLGLSIDDEPAINALIEGTLAFPFLGNMTTAIDAAADNNIGTVRIVGRFLCNQGLVLKRGVSLRGNWYHSTVAENWISRLLFVNTEATAKMACLVVDRAEDSGIEFLEFEGLQITAAEDNGGWDHCVYNKEVHCLVGIIPFQS